MSSPPQPPALDEVAEVTRSQPRAGIRWWRWLALAGLLAVLFHDPLLRSLADALRDERPVPPVEAVVILGGDHRHDVVAALYRRGEVQRVWLVEGRPNYLVATGVLPSGTAIARRELEAAGVPAERMDLIGDDVTDFCDTARVLESTLSKQVTGDVLLICNGLDGRHVRFVVEDVLSPELAKRVHILGLPYDDFDMQAWWKSRTGLKQVFGQCCAFGFTLVWGTKPRPAAARPDPDAMERELAGLLTGTSCYEF